jgi:hypothetical protein
MPMLFTEVAQEPLALKQKPWNRLNACLELS